MVDRLERVVVLRDEHHKSHDPDAWVDEVAVERQRNLMNHYKRVGNGPYYRVARHKLAQMRGKTGYGIPPV